ncbi:MAG: addiction module protein [Chitinophagaceae bacterium]|nr:addiction module protein [Chitinophagaceae bacterium]
MSASIIDKKKIIDAIRETDDDRILFAISRLLEIKETDIPDWHKEILEERLLEMNNGTAEFESRDAIKDSLLSKK